eukprot:TRINITY_DN1689_c0_g1_i1.p1 TRINITY_DN1689_c0_g1~~TRINITY_DN1689_c0_g1_i1.p1  ORF type:complete len:102 (+),score=11.18 TRINITY_DN1689_c0_g1_i1:16-321(+)
MTSCVQHKQLSISLNSDYVPLCNSSNPVFYDGCQCNKGDDDTLTVCWCSDLNGNLIAGKAVQANKEDSMGMWQQLLCQCVELFKFGGCNSVVRSAFNIYRW